MLRTAIDVRLATPGDGAALCDLFARVGMDAELALSVRRDPDFFALYGLQSAAWDCWVAEAGGRVEGMATILTREGYLAGAPRRVGYLGDLRISPTLQGRHLLNRVMGPLLEESGARHGCELFLTAVIASNQRALRALTVENRRSRTRPPYRLVRPFRIRSLHLTLPRRARRSAFRVRRGEEGDIPAIARLLDEDGRRRPFGYPMPEAELRRRLASWPGLTPASFYLAEGPAGELVGCLAVWDAAPVKRTRVVEYRGRMRWIRRGYDLGARLLGYPRLPAPGGELRYLYATHQAIPTEDPAVLRALLDAVYADFHGSGYHFLSACVLERDPLEAAFAGFARTDLAARLYLVTPPGVEPPPACFADARPGFEMALV